MGARHTQSSDPRIAPACSLTLPTLTSAGAKAQRSPSLAARAAPSEEGRSRITAEAPFCTRRSTVARPRPDAPPDTRPTIPCKHTRMGGGAGEAREGSEKERKEGRETGEGRDE